MPTVRAICTDALTEIGVLADGEGMSPSQGARCLLRCQHMIDAWQAQRLALAIQLRTTFTLTSGSSSVTLGPSGADVTMARPVWIDSAAYVVPSSSPAVESPIAVIRDPLAYAQISIKSLSSALPTDCFYQTSLDTALGTLTFWPVVSQNVTIAIYTPQGIGVPATLDSVLTGPPGYQEAFLYQLAVRLLTPFGVPASSVPLLVGENGFAETAWRTIARVNLKPGTLTLDPALVPYPTAAYNVLTDQ